MILEGHTKSITCIKELPDGRIISGSNDRTLKIWNLKNSDSVIRCEMTLNDDAMIKCMKILPGGQIITGSGFNIFDDDGPNDGSLKLWS